MSPSVTLVVGSKGTVQQNRQEDIPQHSAHSYDPQMHPVGSKSQKVFT
jgi:hypothetical protein